MPNLTLVSGCRSQATTLTAARDLYLSRCFRLGRALAESRGDWRVLSSQHGLLAPDTTIAPYDPRKPRGEWYDEVAQDLLALTEPGDTVTVLSSTRHEDALRRPLEEAGRYFEMPLDLLSLDQQVAWLEEQLTEADVAVPGSRQRSVEEKQARKDRRAARRRAV